MSRVASTRRELLIRLNRRRVAERGLEVLEDQRTLLVRELRDAARLLMRGGEALETAAQEAVHAVVGAQTRDGPAAVHAAALTVEPLHLDVEAAREAGVEVSRVRFTTARRTPTDRGYTPAATSAHVDAAADAFERQVDLIVELATLDGRVRNLAAKLARTTRRVNALNEVVIPRIEREIKTVRAALGEREREDQLRLRLAAVVPARSERHEPRAQSRDVVPANVD